jgi:undecaprenyl-diphosphatase
MHTTLLFIAKYLFVIVGLTAFLYWVKISKQEKVRLIVFGAIASVVTLALVKIGAALFFDSRPFVNHHVIPLYPHAADNGFPSDHTALTAFIALTIFISSKRLGIILLIMSILIGVSRVVGHIHSPIDIIGSLVFAVVGYGAARQFTPYLLKRWRRADEHLSAN